MFYYWVSWRMTLTSTFSETDMMDELMNGSDASVCNTILRHSPTKVFDCICSVLVSFLNKLCSIAL